MSPSALKTPTRLAWANAAILLFVWTAYCYVRWSLRPEWERSDADERLLEIFLVLALGGGGMTIVFWRVRSIYQAGEVRINRAVTEGLASAAAYYLMLFAVFK